MSHGWNKQEQVLKNLADVTSEGAKEVSTDIAVVFYTTWRHFCIKRSEKGTEGFFVFPLSEKSVFALLFAGFSKSSVMQQRAKRLTVLVFEGQRVHSVAFQTLSLSGLFCQEGESN